MNAARRRQTVPPPEPARRSGGAGVDALIPDPNLGPYGVAARDYLAAGWGKPLPLPFGQKKTPPDGWTGHDGADPSAADVEAWISAQGAGNICMRLAPGIIGIDCDAWKGPAELAAWQALVDANGPLPESAPWSTSRGDGVSGIRLFRVPPDYVARGVMPDGAGEVIQRHHRYVVAPPSHSPAPPAGSGGIYRWAGRNAGDVPQLDDLPTLPGKWQKALKAGPAGDGERQSGWTAPDIDALVTGGIPAGANQDEVLRDVVYQLAAQSEAKAPARLIWRAIVSHTTLTRPSQPWTDDDFERHWKGAGKKIRDQAPPPPGGPDARVRRIVLTPASQIVPEPVVWAWEDDGDGRIPAGSLGLAAGREGTGKSSAMLWAAARVTTGTLPGAFYGTPRAVIVVAVEDSWKHTIVPRLIAAGADLAMVYRAEVQIVEDETVMLSLPADNKLLEEAIGELRAALVVIDPLLSAVSDTLDTHVNRQVRQALDPLSAIADRTGAVIAGVAHFNKSSGSDASTLITASGAFKDVARWIFAFAVDGDPAKGAGVITQTKNSLGRLGLPSLAYRIISAIVPTPTGDADVGRFVIDGPSERTVGDILGEQAGGGPSAKADAERYLRQALADGPRRSADVEDEARNGYGISERTLRRARRTLLIPSARRRSGPPGEDGAAEWEWWICLPEHEGDLKDQGADL